MKYIRVVALLVGIFLLVACHENGGSYGKNEHVDATEVAYISDERPQLQMPDEIIEEVENLTPILYLSSQLNQVSLFDLTIGEQVAVYQFDEYEVVQEIWDLGDDYFAVFVGYENSWVRAQRLWLEEGNIGMADVEWDERTQTERNFRLVIFDESLTVLDTVPYDEEEHMSIGYGRYVRLVNGEFFVYGTHFDSNCMLNGVCNFQRLNAHTAEVEALFGFERGQSLVAHGFVGEYQMLLSATSDGGQMDGPLFSIQYGIFDLATGEKHLFERENFLQLEVIYSDSSVLISGLNTANEVRSGEVIVFDTENMMSEVIQLGYKGSFAIQFSFDGEHIVTINDSESVFRKYDLNGTIVAEVETDFPYNLNPFNTHIFPLSDHLYVIKLGVWFDEGMNDGELDSENPQVLFLSLL